MPSLPTPQVSPPTGRASKDKSGDVPRTPPKPQVPSSPRRTHSYTPHSGNPRPNVSARPAPARRHTTQTQHHRSDRRLLPDVPRQASRHNPSRKRTTTSSASPSSKGESHVLIPVPIRARDAESPTFIRAPSGQPVDFVFSPPKKRGLIGRLLDSVEWGDPQKDKPYRYRVPNPKPSSRPFYKKLLS